MLKATNVQYHNFKRCCEVVKGLVLKSKKPVQNRRKLRKSENYFTHRQERALENYIEVSATPQDISRSLLSLLRQLLIIGVYSI